ncbi:MAG TPA: hypothetical protein EYO73_01950 [Sulfurimonas sp.]|nr:hypothetical protein [Sulfurimonas sp.]
MAKINWDEYKKYKHERPNPKQLDNFEILLEFLRSFYNKTSAFDVFDMLNEDELGKMMLDKRSISQPAQLEDFLYKWLAK